MTYAIEIFADATGKLATAIRWEPQPVAGTLRPIPGYTACVQMN